MYLDLPSHFLMSVYLCDVTGIFAYSNDDKELSDINISCSDWSLWQGVELTSWKTGSDNNNLLTSPISCVEEVL